MCRCPMGADRWRQGNLGNGHLESRRTAIWTPDVSSQRHVEVSVLPRMPILEYGELSGRQYCTREEGARIDAELSI